MRTADTSLPSVDDQTGHTRPNTSPTRSTLLAEQRADELVAAHADVAVVLPDRRPIAVLTEDPVPGDRVLVVALDEVFGELVVVRGRHVVRSASVGVRREARIAG
jgi:hypothetical protein